MLEGVSDHSERPNRIHNKALLLSALKSFVTNMCRDRRKQRADCAASASKVPLK